MPLVTSYLTTTKNLEGILGAIQTAQAPEKFTTRFLTSLGYTSAADRLVIGVLKGLGLLDETGAPTEHYYKFLDQAESKRVLAERISEAYDDLFRINTKAYELSESDVKNKLRTLTQGQKSDGVLDDMAKTFVALSSLADWTIPPKAEITSGNGAEPKTETTQQAAKQQGTVQQQERPISLGQLCYNIQIILPATRDSAVYDALFKSLKEHLLK